MFGLDSIELKSSDRLHHYDANFDVILKSAEHQNTIDTGLSEQEGENQDTKGENKISNKWIFFGKGDSFIDVYQDFKVANNLIKIKTAGVVGI